MAFTPDKLKTARDSGYTDDEIWDFLGKDDQRFNLAKENGYSLDDTITTFSSVSPAQTAEPEPDQPFFAVEDVVSAIGTIPEALSVGVPAAFQKLVTGTAMPEESEAMEKDIAFQERMQQEQADRTAAGKSSSVGQAIREAAPSISFSLGSMGSGIAGAIGGTAIGGPVGGTVGGMAASGTASYRMAAADLLYRSFKALEEQKGSPLTEEEKAQAYKEFLPLAQNSALWEAGPEAVSNAVLMGAGKFVFGFGKPLARKLVGESIERVNKGIASKVAAGTGAVAAELGTETITALGQFAPEMAAQKYVRTGTTEGAPTEYPGGAMQAFKDVAPATLALTGMMVGAGGVAKAATLPFQKAKTPEQIAEDNINLDAEREADNLLIPDTDEQSKSIKSQIDTERADLALKKELYNTLPNGDKTKAVLATEIKEYEGRITELDNTLRQRLGLSLPITTAEQQQIELARAITAPAEAAPTAKPKAKIPPPPPVIITDSTTSEQIASEISIRKSALNAYDFGTEGNNKLETEINKLEAEFQSRKETPTAEAPAIAPALAPATISTPSSIAPTDWESAIRSAPRVPMFPGDSQRRQTVSAIPILKQANATPGMAVVAINGRTGTVTGQRDSMGLVVQMDDGTTERMNAFTTFHLQSDVVPFLKAPQQSASQQAPSSTQTKPQPTRVVPSQVVVGDTIQLGGSPRLVTSVSKEKGITTIVAINPETGTQQTLSGSDRMLEVEVVSRAQTQSNLPPAITPAPVAETPAVTPAAEVAPAEEKLFQPDDELVMRSPYTGEDTVVSYRGKPSDGQAVVWTGKMQMQIPESWLREKGTEFTEKEPAGKVAPEIAVEEVVQETPKEEVEKPFPKTKKGLVEELSGEEPKDYALAQDWKKTVAALNKQTKEELAFKVSNNREQDKKFKATQKITSELFPKIKKTVDAAGTKWVQALKTIASENGFEKWTTLEGNSKGEEIYRLANRIASSQITTPAVSEAPAAEPTGISVGNRIKLGKSPQTYIVEEVVPQSATERELGEQYYSVKNERTGEVRVVEKADMKQVKGKGARKMDAVAIDTTPENILVTPPDQQYTFNEVFDVAYDMFGGKIPEGFTIVNDSTDKDFEFKAAYIPATGDIIVNLAYLNKNDDIRDAITHELGHYIFGDPEFRAAFDQFIASLSPKARAELDAYVEKAYNKETGETRLEEKLVRAFVDQFINEEQAPAWRSMLDAIKRFLNKLGFKFNISDRDAISVFTAALERYKAGEAISREGGADIRRMAAEPAPEKPAMDRYKGKAQVAGVPGIGAEKDTPKGINKKTEEIIKDRVFDATIVNDNQTKKAWNLIQKIEEKNPESGKNAQAINELTRETMQDVEADEVVKQSIGAVKLRNELYSYAIKLAGEGDPKMLNYLLNTRLSIGSGNIVEGDAGRLLQAMASLKSWIVRATEAEQQGFFEIAAQQFFGTKTPTDEQVQQIKDIFNKVKEVKIDQEKELMTELEEVGKAAGIDLPAAVDKQLENTPGLDPMVVAMTAMQKLYGGTITTQYEPMSKRAQGRFEGVKKIIQGGITNYRQKIVSKAANGLETGFWKTLSSTENKPGPLGELDSAQNQALGNIVKKTLVDMKLQGTPPDTKMSIYEQVASILGEQPLSKDKINMADEKIRSTIKDKRQAELDNATEDQVDAINLKYDEMTFAWDNAMSRSLDMPVSDTMLRRMILNELKEADTSIQDIATLMDEEPVIGTSRQDRLVNSIIEKVTGITFEGQLTRDYTNLKSYLSSLLENMVIARQQKNKAAKAVAKTRRDASGDPDKQAQAQIDRLAKIQADPTIFGEKRIDLVRNAVRDALSLQLNIGFTPEQSANIKAGWKGAFAADPNKKGIPTSFMLELQRLGVSEAGANTLADIVWRQIEVNAMSRQIDATTKAVEAGPIGGIVQAILDTPLANQQDPNWRKNVILDYLKNAGVKPNQAENIAKLFDVSLRKRFAKAQEEAAIKAAKSIKGGLTTNSSRALEKFLKAIRAQVLDPGKDVAKAFAEEMGWKGFTSEQIVKLNELDAIVNDNERTDAEISVATEQIQKIIDKVSMPPQIKEVLGSFYIGNALMRFTTFAVQAFDPLAMTTFNTAIESFRNITNPQQFIQTWANYGRAISNLAKETAFSYKNDILRSGRMIDYLDNQDRKIKRLADESVRKFKAGDIRGAMKDGIIGYTAWTFRTLKALDDGAYSLLTSTTLPQYVEAALKNAKIPREKRRGVMRQVLEAREMDIKRMVADGVSKDDAVIYANERMQAAITKELSGLNIDAQEVINSAINDALARIGKTRFAEDILTGKVEEIKDLGTISAPFLRWYESVSKAVSGSGSESQKIFYRILLGFPLIPARIFNIAAGYTPLTIYRHALKNRYSLTYGTALQRRQRLAEQLAGTMVLLPLLALRSNSTGEEDEKEKGFGVYITGQGPSRMKDKTLHAKWNDRHDPFSLEFRMGGKTKFSIDAKAAGPLSVMIYLLGAMDDWETNRRLDGLKTSKDDWKEAQDKASIFTSLYELGGYAVLTTARRGPTTGVMQGLVDFRRFPDDPIAAIGADVSFSAMPAVPILGTGIAKNLSDFFSQPIDNTTKEGAILSNIPIVGSIAGKPALNSYGQRLGELRVSEKLKKSFGVPFTLVVSDNEEDNKLTSLTLKFGDGPTPLRREDVENELRSAISDDEWYLAAKTFGDRNRSYVLKNYNRYEKMKPAGFSKVMSALGKVSKANAISAVKKARRNNP